MIFVFFFELDFLLLMIILFRSLAIFKHSPNQCILTISFFSVIQFYYIAPASLLNFGKKGKDHSSRACPNQKCNKCGGLGHKSRYCTVGQEDDMEEEPSTDGSHTEDGASQSISVR